jgi:hypothetical protein
LRLVVEPEAPSDSVEVSLERARVAQSIAAALGELKEPYWSTLRRRFFEELTAIEIARADGDSGGGGALADPRGTSARPCATRGALRWAAAVVRWVRGGFGLARGVGGCRRGRGCHDGEGGVDDDCAGARVRQRQVCTVAGVRETPTLFVNGDIVQGERGIDELSAIVEEILELDETAD